MSVTTVACGTTMHSCTFSACAGCVPNTRGMRKQSILTDNFILGFELHIESCLPEVGEDSPVATWLRGGSPGSVRIGSSHPVTYQKEHEERDRHTDKLELDGIRVSLAVLERRGVVHMIEALSDEAIQGRCSAVEIDHRTDAEGSSDWKSHRSQLFFIHSFASTSPRQASAIDRSSYSRPNRSPCYRSGRLQPLQLRREHMDRYRLKCVSCGDHTGFAGIAPSRRR